MKLGALDISTVKLGANQVQAVYQGSNLVWQNAPVATAATGVGQTSFTANWNAYSGATYYLLDVSESSDFSTFVYENQITTSTSYVVIGLESNTTYYYRVRANVGYDADAQAFFDRVTTAGGSLSTTEQDAVNTLVIDMKTDGIWTKMKAIYPMVGASAAACAQNLTSSSFTGTFASGASFSSAGYNPNGSGYMDTGLVPNGNLSQNSVHIAQYFPAKPNDTSQIGVADSGFSNALYTFWNLTGFGMIARLNQSSDTFFGSTGLNNGFGILTRNSSTQSKYYINNSLIATSTSGSNGLSSFPITLGGRNIAGSITDRSTGIQSFASIGNSLTDTEASDFYTAVQGFNQTLNRNVGPQVVSDADAQAYINRVYNAGGTLTNTEANAVNQLTIDMKSAGIWNAMKAVYPMVGASAEACAQNLKSSSFTGSFTATGWTFASTGATPNGTSAYMDTGLNANAQLNINSSHISYYARNLNTSTGFNVIMGIGSTTCYMQGSNNSVINTQLAGFTASVIETPIGFLMGNKQNSTTQQTYKNNLSSTSTGSTTSFSTTTQNIFIGNYDTGGAFGTNSECAFSSIGDGFSNVEALALYNIVQNFNTTLSRQV
jgi:hypothetical protein